MTDDEWNKMSEYEEILRCSGDKLHKRVSTTMGIIPLLFNITNKEIAKVIEEYRLNYPDDERSDIELNPYAVNSILNRRKREEQ